MHAAVDMSEDEHTPVWPMTLVWLFFRLVMTLGDVVEAGRDAPRREQARRGAADIQPAASCPEHRPLGPSRAPAHSGCPVRGCGEARMAESPADATDRLVCARSDRDRSADEALRQLHAGSRTSRSRCDGARCTGSSGPTARARRPRSGRCSTCCTRRVVARCCSALTAGAASLEIRARLGNLPGDFSCDPALTRPRVPALLRARLAGCATLGSAPLLARAIRGRSGPADRGALHAGTARRSV